MLDINTVDWGKMNNLIPVIIQDNASNQVLMLGYMNPKALLTTLETKRVTFYSRSKKRLWTKGETSGNYLELIDIKADCDQDSLLIQATPQGNTCHLERQSCFNTEANVDFLSELENTIRERIDTNADKSYTVELYNAGIPRIAQKVGEEGVEVALAAATNADNFIDEVADLFYHVLVLLVAKNRGLQDVIQCLEKR